MATRLPHLNPNVLVARVTIPARERLEARGNRVAPMIGAERLWAVELVRPPAGLVLIRVGVGPVEQSFGLRLTTEPRYPAELRPDAIAWWERGDLAPCPQCGHALLWCEAGYVPGWRICLAGHACRLSLDGSRAYRRRTYDAGTLRSTVHA